MGGKDARYKLTGSSGIILIVQGETEVRFTVRRKREGRGWEGRMPDTS